jgi:acid phosphatase family membrane protein YuiD
MLVDAVYEQRPHSFRNKLIELLGHTPLEVTMGALLGIAISLVIHYRLLLG